MAHCSSLKSVFETEVKATSCLPPSHGFGLGCYTRVTRIHMIHALATEPNLHLNLILNPKDKENLVPDLRRRKDKSAHKHMPILSFFQKRNRKAEWLQKVCFALIRDSVLDFPIMVLFLAFVTSCFNMKNVTQEAVMVLRVYFINTIPDPLELQNMRNTSGGWYNKEKSSEMITDK